MDKIARISPEQRAELFQQTAAKFPFLSEAAIEKDFWVCWILKHNTISKIIVRTSRFLTFSAQECGLEFLIRIA